MVRYAGWGEVMGMFVMRQTHLEAFGEAAMEGFEDRMVVHLRVRFRPECEELGEEGTRRRIREGIKRAGRYQITSERDVARFIRFTFGIRPDFDTSRKTPWAGQILREKEVPAGERLDRIKTAARQRRLNMS